jgi:PAS domain S-box-containing protein
MSKQPPVTILHIDDEEANRYLIARMLQKAGFNVIEATRGEAGLQLVSSQRPDLVILDVQLPDISGFEVCQRIKSNPDTTSIPVLHISASLVESKDKAQGLESGADGYLVQPVEAIELIATVRSLLRIRQAEESALTLAQEWQTTFDSIKDGVGLLDREGRFLRCNNAMTELLSKPSSEIIGCLYQEVIQATLGSTDAMLFTGVRETRHRQSIEIRSSGRWFSITVDPVLDEGGAFTGAVYILADITDRRRAEAALQASEERFRLLLENVEDYGILFLDTQTHINGWSVGAERILGYHEAEVLGQPSSIIFTPEDIEQGEDEKEVNTALAEGRAEDERWHIRKDGTRFWASGMLTPLRDERGQLRGFAKILRDFTERKRAEEERAQLLAREQEARAQAEAANRLKDEFLATLSHELRSPLNAMLGWIRLLNSRKFDEKTTARAMETIERSAKSQAQLVEDLLDVSRIIRGQLRLNIRPIELISAIEAAIETVRPAAEAKEIGIQTRLDPVAGLVAGDSDRLQQIVWNLLSNAIKFTPKGGRVDVRLERVNSHVEIIVTDTGQGISTEFVPYVFERFRQADSSITRSYSGLGLGLAIVRHLVELHGGTVRADSPGEGQGATFTVKLPLMSLRVKSDRGERVHSSVESGEPSGNLLLLNGVRVLIVDDETDSREVLTATLEQVGAEVTAVASASEALDAITQLTPDVLVSDIGMPLEDGYSLIRKVRQLKAEQGGQIPAIALTAYARPEDRMRAIAAGFQMHIAKPLEPAELVTMVASLAGRSGLSQSC